MTDSPASSNADAGHQVRAAPPPGEAVAAAVPAAAAGWRAALTGLAVALAGLFAVFSGTAAQMVETWYVSATFNHGFLIVPISGWLLWERREALRLYEPKPSLLGLVPLLACVVAWILANAAGINSGKEFALVGMVQSVVITLLGWRLAKAMLFPLGFLYFAVPFGDFLIPTLQDITAIMVVEGLRLIDIPVFLDGVFLSIPTGKFEVAEACSGIRFLIATIALGCLFANMSFRSRTRRAIIVFLSVLVPIVANGIRAFGIVYIAHITDHTVAVGVDHIVYGWIFFAFVTVVLLGIGMTFRETDGDNDIYMPADADRVPGRTDARKGLVVSVAATLAVAVAGAAYAEVMLRRGVSTVAAPLTVPASLDAWRAADRVATDWRPKFVGADAELMKTYRHRGRDVHLYVAYYTHQRQGAELINSGNTLVVEKKWARASSGGATAPVAGTELTVKETRLVGRETGRLVWEWYWIGGRYTSDRLAAKMHEALAKLFGLEQAAAAIIVAADYDDNPADAEKTLVEFTPQLNGLAASLGRVARN